MKQVTVQGRRRLFDQFFKVDEVTVTVEAEDGSTGAPQRRLVFERGDSVAATVLHRETGELLFTEQLRVPVLAKAGGWLVELMAGMVDEGESPEQALRRELEEELGYRAETLVPVADFFTSPGGSSERIFLFHAEVTAAGRITAGGGLPTEQEDIRIVRMSVAEAAAALEAGRWNDAKTLIGLQWLLARHG
jgi:ADP-ribose pyrophosphatase